MNKSNNRHHEIERSNIFVGVWIIIKVSSVESNIPNQIKKTEVLTRARKEMEAIVPSGSPTLSFEAQTSYGFPASLKVADEVFKFRSMKIYIRLNPTRALKSNKHRLLSTKFVM